MTNHEDHFDEVLRAAFKAGIPEPEYEADKAPPEDIPQTLRARIIEEASRMSSRLLAARVCKAGENAGWSLDDLASEAVGFENEAKNLLLGTGNPANVSPHGLARIFFRVQLEPLEWRELLKQSIVSHAKFRQPMEGHVWGRTTGLSEAERVERLSDSLPHERAPIRAERAASGFVEEVLEEWKKLTSGRS